MSHKYTLAYCIPVYHAEKYIRRMIGSIVAQKTDFPMQIILAVDPRDEADYSFLSPLVPPDAKSALDKSGLAKIGLTIKHCEKGRGMSCGAARNEAFAVCDADYVWFVDADDWIPSENAANILITAMEETGVDVTVADYESSIHAFNPFITVWTKMMTYETAKKFPFADSNDQEDKENAQSMFSEQSLRTLKFARIGNVVYHYNWPRPGSLTDGRVLP